MDIPGAVILGTIEYQEAKRLKSCLEEQGVTLWLKSDPESCDTGSCSPKVEVWVQAEEIPVVKAFLAREQERSLQGLNADPELLSSVFDTDEEKARCPACGAEFSTALKECPDCGLVFIPEGSEESG